MNLPIIYEIREHYTNSDHEGWQHWIDDHHVSYHSTRENAEKGIKARLQSYIDLIPQDAERNRHIDAYYWEHRFYYYQNNIFSKQVSEGEEYCEPLLFIEEIHCED